MAMFGLGRGGAGGTPGKPKEETRPLVGRKVYCRICSDTRSFSRCWRRIEPMRQCPCCGLAFENLAAVYAQVQPLCPRCQEPLEVQNFDYGLCDTCGSKFEIMEGTKPGLLPNRAQRIEMDKFGRTRSQRP